MSIQIEFTNEELQQLMEYLHEHFKSDPRFTIEDWMKLEQINKHKLNERRATYQANCLMEKKEYSWKNFCDHIGITYLCAVKYHVGYIFTQSLIDNKVIQDHVELNKQMYEKLYSTSKEQKEKWEKKANKKKNKGKNVKPPTHDIQLTKKESEEIFKRMDTISETITTEVIKHVQEYFPEQNEEKKKLLVKVIVRLLCDDLRLVSEIFREYPIVRYEMKNAKGQHFGMWDWIEFIVKHVPEEVILLWMKSVDEYYAGFRSLAVAEQTADKMKQLKI